MEQNGIAMLQELIDGAQRIVFFGGAGASTESGIPDFRGEDGIYRQPYPVPPETMLHIRTLKRRPKRFFEFYRQNMIYPNAKPNAAHRKLAELERAGKLSGIITQNIDGLHQLAGSRNVVELHGSVLRNSCIKCGKEYPEDFIMETEDVPRCTECGGIVRPDVVLYGEALSSAALDAAAGLIREADLLIVGGTSLTVQPAASLVACFGGEHLVLINLQETPADPYADLVLHEKLGEVLSQITVGETAEV
ncbi:MAG TPA: NAD-dependent protein deacylase [Oscillospiraceae bacterium]|nr:NAD-dependent protein deacylase [Oscillospiraceae bacterium]